MTKLLKYFLIQFRKIDISPLDDTHLSFKIAIFLVWGVNVLFFISHDAIASEIYSYPTYKYKSAALTLQVSPLALPDNGDIEFFTPVTGVISSLDVNLVVYQCDKILRDRSPPQILI